MKRGSSTSSISSDDECCRTNQTKKSFLKQISLAVIEFWLIDMIGYFTCVPLITSYLVGGIVQLFEINRNLEMVLQAVGTFFVMYVVFTIIAEKQYWKCLFKRDPFCLSILRIRDIVNTIMVCVFLIGIAFTIQEMIKDQSLKPNYLNEGVSYVFFKYFFRYLHVDENNGLAAFGLHLPHKATLTDPNFGENERFEHSARLMLFIAMLAVGVAKMVYFNALFTFIRAMAIFLSLKPIFERDKDKGNHNNINTKPVTVTVTTTVPAKITVSTPKKPTPVVPPPSPPPPPPTPITTHNAPVIQHVKAVPALPAKATVHRAPFKVIGTTAHPPQINVKKTKNKK